MGRRRDGRPELLPIDGLRHRRRRGRPRRCRHEGRTSAATTTPPAGHIPNATDCNDTNPAVFNVYYHDADGDGYGNAGESICAGATPPAGYVVKNTDCDDTLPAVHPLAPDAQCDGLRRQLQRPPSTKSSWTTTSTCGVGACASTGFAHCAVGAFSDTCIAGAPGTETCNGIDDNCDGTVDNAAAPTGTPARGAVADLRAARRRCRGRA